MPSLANFTKMSVRDVVEGDTIYWEYRDKYRNKCQAFGTVIGITQGKKKLLGPRAVHLMLSIKSTGSVLTGERAGSALVWVMNREPEL